MEAILGTRRATSRRVPWVPWVPAAPAERGKSSYQEEKRARSRSIQRGSSGGVPGGEAEVGILGDECDEIWSNGRIVVREVVVGEGAQLLGGGEELLGVAALGAGGCGVEVEGTDTEGQGDVLYGVGLGGEALVEVVDPGIEVVDPGFDGEVPEA